jgi:NAD(P)-dependent dehydrogenase (short-subunit alcohol dehydrogenase family)
LTRDKATVAVLMFDRAPMFEMSVPISVFGVDRTPSGAPGFTLLPVAVACLRSSLRAGSIAHTPTSRGRFMADTTAKVAVVTGASQGIGATLVGAFRQAGYNVVANSRFIKPSEDPGVRTVSGDIGESATASAIVDEAVREFGRIDTLVNNAGIFIAKPFTEYTAEDYTNIVSVNLNGFYRITQLAVKQMLAQGGGHIVSITTSLVNQADSNVPSVLASLTKGGIDSATKSLAIEYAKRGIRVNAVSPGIIDTPMHPSEAREMLAGLHPVGRLGTVEDIARAVMFLEAASFVTGEILHVDGGQSAGH